MCQFYKTKQDLIDVLVPYFVDGLKDNEFCVWVTSEFLNKEEAIQAMQKALPNFYSYLEKGQMEIFPYTEWYLKEGKFELQRVLNGWVEKHDKALAAGYVGTRVTGNPFWIDNKTDWDDFAQYEAEINKVIANYKLLVLCTYSLDKCQSDEIIDVITNHEFGMIKRQGKWALIENSAHKEIEKALRKTETKFLTLYSSMTEGVAFHDIVYDKTGMPVDYIITEVNPAFEKITGISKEDAVGIRASKLYGTGDAPFLDFYAKVTESGKPAYFETYFSPMKKHFNISCVSPSKGKFATVFHDITDRKKAEEALKQSEQLYHTVFDNSQDGFQLIEVIYGKNKKPVDIKLLRVNDAYEKIIGVKASEIIGKTATYISPNCEPYWFEIPVQVATTGKPAHAELYNKDINKWLDCYYFPYAKNIVGTLFSDITERKNLEKQLQDKERLAAIGTTAGMVGHDIRNPLQAMMSDVYLLKHALSSMPQVQTEEGIVESLDSIETNIGYINKIVADLQDYGRLIKPELTDVNLYDLVTSVFQPIAIPDNVKLLIEIDNSIRFTTDQTLFRRILTNLVANAIQAMSNGGKLTLTGSLRQSRVCISVEDSGVGIPEKIKPKLFTPMMTTKAKGQGLGLAVVKRLVEAMAGDVTFESQEGKGTKFTIKLPLR